VLPSKTAPDLNVIRIIILVTFIAASVNLGRSRPIPLCPARLFERNFHWGETEPAQFAIVNSPA
jgi:hypothetical protein